jgi:hypothetical protein
MSNILYQPFRLASGAWTTVMKSTQNQWEVKGVVAKGKVPNITVCAM